MFVGVLKLRCAVSALNKPLLSVSNKVMYPNWNKIKMFQSEYCFVCLLKGELFLRTLTTALVCQGPSRSLIFTPMFRLALVK